MRKSSSDLAEGVRVAHEGVKPDAVVDLGVLDLPIAPVVVAQGPALHFPFAGVGWLGRARTAQASVLGAENGPVHRSPFLGAEEIGDAFGDDRLRLGVFGGVSRPSRWRIS